jgi:arginine-tRNA-protein transferase
LTHTQQTHSALFQEYFITPISLSRSALDDYLARGYYRMGQMLFTTNFIPKGPFIYPVYWLRTNISRINHEQVLRQIKKALKNFTYTIEKAYINNEINNLYEQYKKGIDFDTYESVQSCLSGDSKKNIFDTRMVQIRDHNRLIATGYFDCGLLAIMGILNFYDPQYKRFGLGKLLMLLKLEFAIQNQYLYYYTGYFSTRYPKFDYKLYPDKNAIDVFLPPLNKWVPYTSVTHDYLDNCLLSYFNLKF